MKPITIAAGVLCTALIAATPVHAGPPLICHPFDIGTATSLPIGPADGGWSATDPAYDRGRLVQDTLALLTPQTPTLVRMETLRRATMYVADDRAAASRLLQALEARSTTSAPGNRAEAMASFDVGYLVETYRQLGAQKPALSAAVKGDGYLLVTKAMQVVTDDPSMHFAAALMTQAGPHQASHQRHARLARAAAGDPLLSRNVRRHLRDA